MPRPRLPVSKERVARLMRQRPDATAVHRPGPEEGEVFDPDLWTPPNQPLPHVQYARRVSSERKPKRARRVREIPRSP